MSAEEIPEADCAPGAPHPRFATDLVGQPEAEAAFLAAFQSDRLHHAWLISGPKGVGKATLAWRLAKFLLTAPVDEGDGLFGAPEPPTSLEPDPSNPVLSRLAALSESRLALLRRPWDAKTERLRTEITVDEVRKLKERFAMSAADGGRRVVIVDAVDEMNTSAANAFLKLLEEPPENAFMLLVCHQPSKILPTIRSRCRSLRCRALAPDEVATVLAQSQVEPPEAPEVLAELSGGSAGAAIRLLNLDGLALYADLVAIFGARRDRAKAISLANSVVGRANAERLDLALELIDTFLVRLARAGTLGPPAVEAAPGEAELIAALCKHAGDARRWASLAQEISTRARHGQAVNLDPAALILDIVIKFHDTAAASAA